MLVNSEGETVKLSPGMEIKYVSRTRTISINDRNGERLFWHNGADDKKFCCIRGRVDFMVIAEMIADTHGLYVALVKGYPEDTLVYRFTAQIRR